MDTTARVKAELPGQDWLSLGQAVLLFQRSCSTEVTAKSQSGLKFPEGMDEVSKAALESPSQPAKVLPALSEGPLEATTTGHRKVFSRRINTAGLENGWFLPLVHR